MADINVGKTRNMTQEIIETPPEILIKTSQVDLQRMGIWCKQIIKGGTKFGPFVGEKAYEVDDNMDPAFIWEIVDVETKEFLFYINATNPRFGNWMRYINCARFFEEQNIVSEQEGIDIYYQAIKDIYPGEELLTWYEKSPVRRKKGKRKSFPNIKRAKTSDLKGKHSKPTDAASKSESFTDANYVSQRGRKRSVKKYWPIEAVVDSDVIRDELQPASDEEQPMDEASDNDWEMKGDLKLVEKQISVMPSESGGIMESSCGFFQFELHLAQTGKNRLGRKIFECDICAGIYRHSFSLKRHYLRNHINHKYISKVDMLNCSIPATDDGSEEGKGEEKLNDENVPDSEKDAKVIVEKKVKTGNLDKKNGLEDLMKVGPSTGESLPLSSRESNEVGKTDGLIPEAKSPAKKKKVPTATLR